MPFTVFLVLCADAVSVTEQSKSSAASAGGAAGFIWRIKDVCNTFILRFLLEKQRDIGFK